MTTRPGDAVLPTVEFVNETPEIIATSDPNSQVWQDAADVEAERFLKEKYFESRAKIDEKYDPYLDHTLMVSVRHKGITLAMARLVLPNQSAGMPTLKDLDDPKSTLTIDATTREGLYRAIGIENCLEIATIAAPDLQDASISVQDRSIYCLGGVLAVAHDNDLGYLIAGLDFGGYLLYRMKYGSDCIWPIGEKVMYHGSWSVPILANVERALRSGDEDVKTATKIGFEAVHMTTV